MITAARVLVIVLIGLLVPPASNGQGNPHWDDVASIGSEFLSASRRYEGDQSPASRSDMQDAATRFLRAAEKVYLPESNREGREEQIARAERGAALIARVLAVLEESYGEDSPELVPVIVLLADARGRHYDSMPQANLYDRALRLVARQHGKKSVQYAELEKKAGRAILQFSHDYKLARKHLETAYKTYRKLLGPSDPSTAYAALPLANLEFWDEEYRRAQDYLLAALVGLGEPDAETSVAHIYTRSMLVRAYELDGKSDRATEHCVAVGRLVASLPEQEYKPIFLGSGLIYPPDMIAQGKEGFVDVSYTVDEQGFAKYPVAIAVDGDQAFVAPALQLVGQYRFAPKFENGKPVATENVKSRITFKLEEHRLE